jgi:membrane protease YdiL (CAAX protease family)
VGVLSRLEALPAGIDSLGGLRSEGGVVGGCRASPGPALLAPLLWARRSGWAAVPLVYLAAIAAAELATVLIDPLLGASFHVLILAALILHASLVPDRPLHKLLVALSLAPLIRILSLSFPLQDVDLIYWYAIIAAPLLVAILFIASTIGLKREELGLTVRALRLQMLVASSGLAFGVVEYFILEPEPLIEGLTWASFLIPALILLIATGLVEELAFRGVLQSAAATALGKGALLYVATLFAVLHVGYRSPLDVAFVFCIGLFYGWVVAKTRSLLGVTLSHGLANVVLFLWIPFTGLGTL